MKKIILLLLGLAFISISTSTIENKIEEYWESLFDGKTLYGWHRFSRKGGPSIRQVKDRRLAFVPGDRPKVDYIQDIVTDISYVNFVLLIKWDISERGSSDIFWAVQEGESFNKPYSTGPEIQVLDSERYPDAQVNPKPNQGGELYDPVQPTKDVFMPAREWNHVLLTIDHNKNQGSVRLNGAKIIEPPLSGPKWNTVASNSKFNDDCDFKYFGKFTSGKIGLQNYGDKVSLRDIKIWKV
tara:strand:- start:472 stop:1191 length:720 start_codon:yes stop_codon:yes gene_type:complete